MSEFSVSSPPPVSQEFHVLRSGNDPRLVLKEFEGIFLEILLSEMRKTVGDSGLFEKSQASKNYEDMVYSHLARALARGQGIGLAEALARQMGVEESAETVRHFQPVGLEVKHALDGAEAGSPLTSALANAIPNVSTQAPQMESSRTESALAAPAPELSPPEVGNTEPRLPAEGRVTSSFGWRRDPLNGRTSFHPGIDIAMPEGTPIRATSAGRVTYSGWEGGYGRTVVLSHEDGSTSRYAHTSRLLVPEGRKVEAGEIIALSGSSGRATAPHLHYEVRQGSAPMDPLDRYSGGSD